MPTALPIACTLSATELPERLGLMAELGRDAAGVELSGTRATLRFAAGPAVRERVERFVVVESACCAFLSMQVRDEPGTVVLDISAPDDAEPVLKELVDAFRVRRTRPSRGT
jgi:hypothetical protein